MNKFPRCCLKLLALASVFFSTNSHAAYEQKIYYVGMSCASIQRDSAITPANEIFIHTHVTQLNNRKVRAQTHPRGKPGYYKKVTKGFLKHENTLIWQGRQQPVELRVTMWEHDNGGTAVHVFSNYLTMFLTGKVTNAPEGGSVGGPSEDPVTMAFKNAGDRIFGTGNDFVGYQRVRLDKGDWSGEPRKRRGSITYNFVTHHRKGGANCKAYFLFERGDSYKELTPPKKPTPHRPTAKNDNQHHRTNEQPHPQAVGQNLEQAQYQCKQTYDACHREAVNCQSQFDREYNRCTQNLRDKLNDCVEWHRKKHGRSEPKCNQFKDTRKYCGHPKSKCRTVSECKGAKNRCQSAASLNNQDQQFYDKLPQTPETQFEPPSNNNQPPPLTKEQRGYLVWIKNECKQDVSVAYRFKSFVDNAWVTKGWINLKPGEKILPKLYTENPLAYFHSTTGKIQDGAHHKPVALQVVNDSFKHIRGTKLTGNGLRKMPFHRYSWKASQIKNIVRIAECATHEDKRASKEPGKNASGEALFDIASRRLYTMGSIDRLVKRGAPVNARNAKGETPIFVAAKSNNTLALAALLRNGADVNAKDNMGNSTLHLAVSEGNSNAVKTLIRKGANVKAKNKAGLTIIDSAISKNNTAIVNALVSAGAKVNIKPNQKFKNGNTLLHQAVIENDLSLATKLLEGGADVNAQNNKGITPLYSAWDSSKEDLYMAKLLLKHDAKPNIVPRFNAQPLINRSIQQYKFSMKHKEKLIELLVDHDANINAQDNSGYSALHSAAFSGRHATIDFKKMVSLLISHGIDVNLQDKQKNTALHVAAERFFSYRLPDNRISTLLAIGVDPNIKNTQGKSALHLLLNRIIDDCLSKKSWGCKTEKELKAMYETVKLLVAKGASASLKDNKGNTPKKLADQIKNRSLRKKISALLSQ